MCAYIMVFFVTLASNATPSFATALALSFAVPCTNDSSLEDMGCPPTWNGRVRVRWGEIACGLFSGRYRVKPGRTGTSAPPVLFTSWVTWGWKRQPREILEFGEATEISSWVKWVSLVSLGVLALVAYADSVGLTLYEQFKTAFLIWCNDNGLALVTGILGWRFIKGQETSWIAIGSGSLFPALTMVGWHLQMAH